MVKKMLKEKESSGRRLMRLSIKHPEEFRRQLGIVKRKNIPITLLNKIIAAEPGDTIKNPTKTGKKSIKVTRLLERRSVSARNLKMKRRGKT